MKKRIKIMKEVTRTVYVCDLCGKESSRPYKQCKICKREICKNCSVIFDDTINSNYFEYQCISCWKLGQEYRDQREALEIEYDKRYEEIQNNWLQKVKNEQNSSV